MMTVEISLEVLAEAQRLTTKENISINELFDRALNAYQAAHVRQGLEKIQQLAADRRTEFHLPELSEEEIVDLVKEVRAERDCA